MRELYIAASGLQHSQWEGSYYPQGMPREWRLDFYANRFRALLLPPSEWRAQESVLLEAVEELDDDFALFLEAEPEDKAAQALALALAPRCLGVVSEGGAEPKTVRLRGVVPPMTLRQTIEGLVEGEGRALLVIEGEGGGAPDITTLEAAQQIAGLLGVW